MTPDDQKYNQVYNIIRRSQTLILNVKLLGADTTKAKELLNTAKQALDNGDYEKAIEFSKKSMVEVMALKKQIKSGAKPTTPKSEKVAIVPGENIESGQVTRTDQPEVESSSQGSEVVSGPTEEPDQDAKPSVKSTTDDKSDIISPERYETGFSYLIEENRAHYCFKIFSNILSSGHKGLCICRVNPNIIRKKYDFSEDITMLWLTDRESSKEPTISPSLESMIYVAEEFIDKNEEAVILLDGIEYLVSNNGFNPVLRFIRRLIDKISETNSILLIGVGSKAINEQELKLLERELNPVAVN